MDVYESPDSDLTPPPKQLSPQERLAESRRAMEEASARQTLNLVWGLRLIVNAVLLGGAVYYVIDSYLKLPEFGAPTFLLQVLALPVGLLLIESVAVIAYFMNKGWCVVPLHIFSAFSLLNFPFGSVLSILHFLNMRKIRFFK